MAIGKCLKCDNVEQMTEDHIVPKWFKKVLPNFKMKVKLPDRNAQLLCAKCNGTKAGELDYANESVREFMKKFAAEIVGNIRKHEEFTP